MISPSVWVDMQFADEKGRVRMTCPGTIADLHALNLTLREGLRLFIHDDEVGAEARITYSGDEKIWVAELIEGSVRNIEQ